MLEVDCAARLLRVVGRDIPCSIGRTGPVDGPAKREGDGATPRGEWPVRTVLFRPGRAGPTVASTLPWRWIRPDDGWCDDPADPAYNRPVRHPCAASAERLWRDDDLYDVVIVLGHNDAPPVPGRGSAIFLHCWREGTATEGCVALAKPDLLALLPLLRPGDGIRIR